MLEMSLGEAEFSEDGDLSDFSTEQIEEMLKESVDENTDENSPMSDDLEDFLDSMSSKFEE